MKIKSVSIKEDKILKNIDISFENNGDVLNTIVIAGSNGSGKTTLLECIFYGIENIITSKREEVIFEFRYEVEEEKCLEKLGNERDFFGKLNFFSYYQKNPVNYFNEKEFFSIIKVLPKIIYIPIEIKFNKIERVKTNFKEKYKFLNTINNEIINNIPSYIASRITYIANTEEDLTMKQVREKVNKEINGIFDILDIDVKLKGVSKDETSTPIFTNSSGDEFDINGLSSGEKQLFLRTLAIKMLEPENSIILIDEPELSLHPKWQSKIIKVYERIGKNNQIIIATHSPHILGSVPKENLIILTKNNEGKVFPMTGDELYSSYGQPVDRILEDIMGMETTRNQDVFNLLEETRELVREDKYNTLEFKDNYQKLINILGTTDKDLLLINMEVQRRKRGIKNV